MKTIAIIPARGGSKRIPKKNIRLFCGKPMISWSIQAAQQSGLFDRIIVSTDSDEIAQVSMESGAEIPFLRPEILSDDTTGTNAVIRHAIQWLQDIGENINFVCAIYATAPFLQAEYLRSGFDILKRDACDFTYAVTSFSFPIQRSVYINADGFAEPLFPESMSMRSQDLEEAYHDAGQFYWGTASSFLGGVPVYMSKSRPVILPRYLVQDIDTLEDWKRAELMFIAWQAGRNS